MVLFGIIKSAKKLPKRLIKKNEHYLPPKISNGVQILRTLCEIFFSAEGDAFR